MQSVCLGLAGSWEAYNAENLLAELAVVEAECPQAVKSFLPVSEQDQEAEEDVEIEVLENADRLRATVSLSGYVFDNRVSPNNSINTISQSGSPALLRFTSAFQNRTIISEYPWRLPSPSVSKLPARRVIDLFISVCSKFFT